MKTQPDTASSSRLLAEEGRPGEQPSVLLLHWTLPHSSLLFSEQVSRFSLFSIWYPLSLNSYVETASLYFFVIRVACLLCIQRQFVKKTRLGSDNVTACHERRESLTVDAWKQQQQRRLKRTGGWNQRRFGEPMKPYFVCIQMISLHGVLGSIHSLVKQIFVALIKRQASFSQCLRPSALYTPLCLAGDALYPLTCLKILNIIFRSTPWSSVLQHMYTFTTVDTCLSQALLKSLI